MKAFYILKFLFKEQISFSIFNEADYSSRRFTLSRAMFLLSVMSVCALVVLTGLITLRCTRLNRTIPSPVLLAEASINQQQRISAQAQQINLLNDKINGLKVKFEQLQAMKQDICKIGRIEQPVNHENLFGIGGSRMETPSGTDEAEKDDTPAGVIDLIRFPDKGISPTPTVGSTDSTGRMVFLDHSDFYINPIACIPSSLPTRGAIANADEISAVSPSLNAPPCSHRGILLKTTHDGEVMAPANGIITYIDRDKDTGKILIIDHGHGYITRYDRLENVTKEVGQLVLKGEVIGHAETESGGSPAQFYYEIMLNGLPINPEKYTAHDPFLL